MRHVGVLAAVALLHPAILMRRGQQISRGMRWSIALSTGFAIAAFSLGIGIYESYRSTIKRGLFLIDVKSGLCCSRRKSDLQLLVVVSLATGALICALVAPKEARSLRQAAAAAYLSAFIVATIVCVLGTYVAAVHTFPE